MADCSKILDVAQQARERMLGKNIYSVNNAYGPTHPNATVATTISDPLNKKGRGTGVRFDTVNGGNFFDVQARQNAIAQNKYSRNNQYNCF